VGIPSDRVSRVFAAPFAAKSSYLMQQANYKRLYEDCRDSSLLQMTLDQEVKHNYDLKKEIDTHLRKANRGSRFSQNRFKPSHNGS
jgi:hypothetical protein